MRPILDTGKLRALLLAALLAGPAVPLAAEPILLEPEGDLLLVLDGRTQREAEIFSSVKAVVYLVVADELESPLVINPRTRKVESVEPASVVREDDGTVELGDGDRGEIAGYEIQQKEDKDKPEILWKLPDGREAKLIQRPWILGLRGGRALKENPAWAYQARLYEPSDSYLEILRSLDLKNVRVKTYFGSWCPHCKKIVPRILRVADELQGTGIRFQYYGLPTSFVTDPEAESLKINEVPTMLILIDGKEVARLKGEGELNSPEVGLKSVLAPDS